jgi:nucleotide-binding universal stress UspA family protein
VLCAVDLIDRSAVVYNSAAFAQPGGRLVVLTVIPPGRDGALPHDPDRVRESLAAFVKFKIPESLHYRPEIVIDVVVGDPLQEILAACDRHGASLLVIGTHGRGRASEAVLGSVAHQVLRSARTPVAVVPPARTEVASLERSRAIFHLGRAIVPVDPEFDHTRQLEIASTMRKVSDRPLLVFAVSRRRQRAQAAAALESLRERHQLPADTELGVVSHRSVPAGIGKLAAKESAGLIVLGIGRRRDDVDAGAVPYYLARSSESLVVAVPFSAN